MRNRFAKSHEIKDKKKPKLPGLAVKWDMERFRIFQTNYFCHILPRLFFSFFCFFFLLLSYLTQVGVTICFPSYFKRVGSSSVPVGCRFGQRTAVGHLSGHKTAVGHLFGPRTVVGHFPGLRIAVGPFPAWGQLWGPFLAWEQLWAPFPHWEQLWAPFWPENSSGPLLLNENTRGPLFLSKNNCGALSGLAWIRY